MLRGTAAARRQAFAVVLLPALTHGVRLVPSQARQELRARPRAEEKGDREGDNAAAEVTLDAVGPRGRRIDFTAVDGEVPRTGLGPSPRGIERQPQRFGIRAAVPDGSERRRAVEQPAALV